MATVRQNLPTGSGSVTASRCRLDDEADLGVAYQGHAGLATLDYSRRGDSSGVRAGATGGVAITGAGVMPARRLEQSFAVVQVADYAGPDGFPGQPADRPHRRQGPCAGRCAATLPAQRDQPRPDPSADGRRHRSVGHRRHACISQRRPGSLSGDTRHGCHRAPGAARRHAGSGRRHGDFQRRRHELPVALDGLLYVEGLRSLDAGARQLAGGPVPRDLAPPRRQ